VAEVVAPSSWRVARLFARLRWRHVRNGFRGRGSAAIPGVLSLVAALGVAVLLAVSGVASSSVSFGTARAAVTLVGAIAALGALLMPVVLIGTDDSLSAARLVTFPLSTTDRMAGWTAATAVSPYGLAFGMGVIGLLIGRVRSGAGAAIALLAAVVVIVTLAILNRLLVTALAPLMSGRRGRDIGVMVAALLGMSGWVLSQAGQAVSGISSDRLYGLANIARWFPVAAGGRAIVEAGAGRMAASLSALAVAALGLGLVAALWRLAVVRLDGGLNRGDASSKTLAGASIFRGAKSRLPRSVTGAVAARELTYAGRDPKWRVSVLSSLVVGTVLPIVNVVGGKRTPDLTMFGAFSGLMGALATFNIVGFEGRSLWIHLLSGIAPRDYLRGKALAIVALFLPASVVNVVVLAAITGGWRYLPAGVVLAAGALGAGVGLGVVASVVAPLPPAEGTNPFAVSSGRGCATGLLSMVAILVLGVVQLPAAVGLFLARSHALQCLGIAVANLVLAYGIWRLGLRLAARRMAGREPELQTLVVPVG
jgi:ABC-2 type transport system permease protein